LIEHVNSERLRAREFLTAIRNRYGSTKMVWVLRFYRSKTRPPCAHPFATPFPQPCDAERVTRTLDATSDVSLKCFGVAYSARQLAMQQHREMWEGRGKNNNDKKTRSPEDAAKIRGRCQERRPEKTRPTMPLNARVQ
jgi:hypothetical protein